MFLCPTTVDNPLDYPNPSFLMGGRFGVTPLLPHKEFLASGKPGISIPSEVRTRLSCCSRVCNGKRFEGNVRGFWSCFGCCPLSRRLAPVEFARRGQTCSATIAQTLPTRDNGETFWVSQESRVRSLVAQMISALSALK